MKVVALRPLAVILVSTAACSEARDTEDYIPAKNGVTQPKPGGALLGADEACSRLTAAEAEARQRLRCVTVVRECPEFLNPLGGSPCFKYDAATVDACVSVFGEHASCPDFDRHPCVVTAVPDAACGQAGQGGSAGASSAGAGAAGESGEGGAAGVSGDGGVGG